jgi:ABC-2 type transport system ATP-binding protein
MTVVSVREVTKAYGALTAIARVSFEVARGELFGLIGPDGAGKTTLIRLVAGLLRPDAGTLRVLGCDPVREHRAITRAVGYLSQRFSLYGDLTVDENLAFFAEIHGVRDYRARRDRLLHLTQLAPFRARRADQLSGGMKQKLALACTLIHEPQLLLLDEPTTGVDPVSRREFWWLVSELVSRGLTIVMATPYLDEAERCTRVALLHEGRLAALDAPARLQAAYPGGVVEVAAEPYRDVARVLAGVPGVADVQRFGERAHVRLDAPADAAALARIAAALAAARGLRVESIRPVPPSLEDVFLVTVASGPGASGGRAGAADAARHGSRS